MDLSQVIVELFTNVLVLEEIRFNASYESIKQAIANMKDAYLPNPNWMYKYDTKVANYNDAAHRCAYLHKYAMLHAGLVSKCLQSAFLTNSIKEAVASANVLNMCSLGGGPGTDIVALILVLGQVFGAVRCNVRVIDTCGDWKNVFDTIISELVTGRYGNIVSDVAANLSHEYLSADLLNSCSYISYDVKESIAKADITTMIKFISAAACKKTRQMLKEIFHIMKPGAMLLFIDNAAGGFHEMVEEEAGYYGLESVFGPFRHSDYENKAFSRTKYDYPSQYKTKVAVEMWKKSPSSSSRMYEPSGKDFKIQVEEDTVQMETTNFWSSHKRAHEGEGTCCAIM